VEQEEMAVARQRHSKNVSAETNKYNNRGTVGKGALYLEETLLLCPEYM
jgi:hypothetical protein